MFVNRDWDHTEEDDFKLNVQNQLSEHAEAVPQYSNEGLLVGWKIQLKFE